MSLDNVPTYSAICTRGSAVSMFCSQTFALSFTVSAEILKGSLTTMERQIQRLENDIENFPKTDDKQDKFVEKMSISFSLSFYQHTGLSSICNSICIGLICTVCPIFSVAVAKVFAVYVLPGSGKQFKSLGVIGGTLGNLGNESGCLAVRC